MEAPTLKLIHQDSRGEMYQILLPTGQEIMLLHSKAGAVRGGHSHTADEAVILVSGKLLYHKMLLRDMEREHVICPEHGVGCAHADLTPGSAVINTPDQPHYGEFEEESWLLEFKYGPNSAVGEWENVDFEPFRKLVRERMAT